jgi:hypothetical protein
MTGLWTRKTGPSSELTLLTGADARAIFLARDAPTAHCAEYATNGGLTGFPGYFQAKVCLRPPICTSKSPGSTTDLF